jgi:ABC-type antimicrobial peptide transport system permease subunit
VNPNLLVANVRSEAAQIDEQLFSEHLMARLSAIFGLLALSMAAIGIYGVLAFSVTRPTSEIAIRMSLGAMPGEIVSLVLLDGLAPAAIGAALGLLASWGLTRLIAALLFGVTPLDPVTYVSATGATRRCHTSMLHSGAARDASQFRGGTSAEIAAAPAAAASGSFPPRQPNKCLS